jgi:cytoskeletal protein CcmA (bactofilin family)
MGKVSTDESKISSIAAGTEIIGDIVSNGNFRFEGLLKGTINISGKLVVDESGVIEGNITCKSAMISGKIDGKIVVDELLELKHSANIHGDIVTAKISIEEGAIFTGTCNMDSKEPLPKDAKK